MSRYIIKAELNPHGGNPEYAPDKELQDGIEADGFALLTFKDDNPHCIVVHGVTTLDLAKMFANGKESTSIIWQAIAIAEGLNKAAEIAESSEKRNMAKMFAEILKQR